MASLFSNKEWKKIKVMTVSTTLPERTNIIGLKVIPEAREPKPAPRMTGLINTKACNRMPPPILATVTLPMMPTVTKQVGHMTAKAAAAASHGMMKTVYAALLMVVKPMPIVTTTKVSCPQ